ncbi:hypothetical protein [Niastella populi]|uniref:hypothetical protein n=1 Tax=Niastella populi TaxID=550983 RepID=UPI0013FE3839|nr:hypothetical protein [Niastella populi]
MLVGKGNKATGHRGSGEHALFAALPGWLMPFLPFYHVAFLPRCLVALPFGLVALPSCLIFAPCKKTRLFLTFLKKNLNVKEME